MQISSNVPVLGLTGERMTVTHVSMVSNLQYWFYRIVESFLFLVIYFIERTLKNTFFYVKN